MILIADAGSTKTQLTILDPTSRRIFSPDPCPGVNPLTMDPALLSGILEKSLLPVLNSHPIDSIHWYGAGCASPEICSSLAATLSKLSGIQSIEVCSDMLCAARALCTDSPGIVGILGTGSNSCLYDGHSIVANVSPLGYILGDEGSGAVLGRTLLGDIFKRQLPDTVIDKFYRLYPITPLEAIAEVYRGTAPNRYLASFVPFLADNIAVPEIKRMVEDSFYAFLRRNILPYDNCYSLPVNFVGSVAYHFRQQLIPVLKSLNLIPGKILQSPSRGIADYHLIHS